MTPDLAALPAHAINLGVAVGCGALIGSERQIRQRIAGLRTNAPVALGAASFVTFTALDPAEVSPTRVAAQVVSGIGLLGTGIILRDGRIERTAHVAADGAGVYAVEPLAARLAADPVFTRFRWLRAEDA